MANPGDTVYPVLGNLRSLGVWTQVAGLVTGLDERNVDDQYDLLSGVSRSFSITEASAREQKLRDDDLTIELRVPPVSATGCDENVDWPGVAMDRRHDVGVYGPADALAHDDWIGSDGVPTANASGQFEVTGAGNLTLTIPSDFDGRLDDVPLGLAPESVPAIYFTRRSNFYYPARAFNEGAYCWLGWELLKIPINAPSSGSITITLTWREYDSFTDNHKTDSTRTTEFTYGYTEKTADFGVNVVSGVQIIPLALLLPDPYPLYERVVSIKISGFDNGSWVIGEPLLAQANVRQSILKTFEGISSGSVGYSQGGASAHLDAAYEWYDSQEENLLHFNAVENTVRNFDHRVSAGPSALDLTVAYTLEQFASIFHRVSEVFNAERNDTAYYAAVRDDEVPPNILSVCWSFGVCHPNAASPGSNPLEQATE